MHGEEGLESKFYKAIVHTATEMKISIYSIILTPVASPTIIAPL